MGAASFTSDGVVVHGQAEGGPVRVRAPRRAAVQLRQRRGGHAPLHGHLLLEQADAEPRLTRLALRVKQRAAVLAPAQMVR